MDRYPLLNEEFAYNTLGNEPFARNSCHPQQNTELRGGGRATNGNVLKGIERTRLAYDACN